MCPLVLPPTLRQHESDYPQVSLPGVLPNSPLNHRVTLGQIGSVNTMEPTYGSAPWISSLGGSDLGGYAKQLVLLEDAVVASNRTRQIRPSRNRKDARVKIRRGFYLRTDAIPEGLAPWDVARLVTIARARAKRMSNGRSIVMVGEASLIEAGFDTWLTAPDIEYVSSTQRTRVGSSPPVTVHGVTVPAVKERQMPGFDHFEHQQGTSRSRHLVNLAAHLARWTHPLPAVIGISQILDRLAVSPLPDSPAWPDDLIRDKIVAVSTARNRRRALFALDAARSGTESIGESYLLWLLACLLPEEFARTLTTQIPIDGGRKLFRIDVGLPYQQVAFEFDGGSKLTGDPRAGRLFIDRHQALERAGWRLIRLSSSLLSNPERAYSELAQDCHNNGVPIRRGPSKLWVPLHPCMRAHARRWSYS